MSRPCHNLNDFPIPDHFWRFLLAALIAFIANAGCGHERNNWHESPRAEFGIPPYARYLRDSDLIVVTSSDRLSNGVHWVKTSIVNYYGNHNSPAEHWFKDALPATKSNLSACAKVIPHDRDGKPIVDREPIHAQTTAGTLTETVQVSENGIARFYLHRDPAIRGPITLQFK